MGQGFSHVLITRPRAEAEDLQRTLERMGIESIIQPARTFEPRDIDPETLESLQRHGSEVGNEVLLIFTSPRAVEFGLPQLPAQLLASARIAAIGPATAGSLAAAGKRVDVIPGDGFTSESLLEALGDDRPAGPGIARVICAPGGRDALVQSLEATGWDARPIWVYQRLAAEIDEAAVEAIRSAARILAVFTSGDAMETLSRRLPPAAWYAICRGEWLVISERLQRVARAYGPAGVHRAGGPQNTELATAIRSLI